MPPFLSVVTIARNEEKVVERFVNSIREYLGKDVEIVMVDTGSKDNTVALARSLGVNVFEEGERFAHIITKEEERFINSQFNDRVINEGQRLFFYSDARNCADSYATGEWCFSIDLHWVLTSGKKLEARLRNLASDVTSCSYEVALGNSVFSSTRIYRRKLGQWRFRIHEVYEAFIGKPQAITDVSASKVSGDPHGYLPHLAYHFYFGNHEKNSAEYARLLFYFAREVAYQGSKYRNLGIKLLHECASNVHNWIKERSQSAVFIADMEEDRTLKRKNLIWAVSLNPVWREPYLKLAVVAYEEADWSGCIGYAEQALKIADQVGPRHIERAANYTTEPYRLIYISLIQMARVSRMSSQHQNALYFAEEALIIQKKTGCDSKVFINLWREAFFAYSHTGNKVKAQKMFALCNEADPERFADESSMWK